MSYDKPLILATLFQIDSAIDQLQEWNRSISSGNDYLESPEGMKTLAASSMLLEAIGESCKRIDEKTNGELFAMRPEIPWKAVKGLRDHIAHGYFDIDADIIHDVVANELTPIKTAITYLIAILKQPNV